jgi:cytochrome c oxidase assembly protein subunit 15
VGFVALLLLMIAVGGVTRLTRSGLSIVEWKPITGIVPPLTEIAWQTQFELYKQSPESQQLNSQFSLHDYQKIFMWEYWHRLLGRLIFLYALIPGLILWRKKQISGGLLTLFCGLVAAQGLVGWLMVKSGLEHEPQVSPYMLALHFFSALVVLLAVYYQLVKTRKPIVIADSESKIFHFLQAFGVVLLLQVFYGCITSGFKAGYAFNTFPLMAGEFFPPGGLLKEPFWLNFFANPATVQWTHRWLGIGVFLLALVLVRTVMKSSAKASLKGPVMHLMGVCLLQVLLGISNIIFVVPLVIAVAHQLMACLVILAFFNIYFRSKIQGS